MSKDESRPPATAPTPEEISARLEALLKRTHALRRAGPAAPTDGPTWPPPDGDLAAMEVVDVPPRPPRPEPAPTSIAPTARTASEALPPREAAQAESNEDSEPPTMPSERPGADRGFDAPSFGRPDWSSLRLREAPVEVVRTPAWLWLLVAALVIALGVETAYLLRTQPWAAANASALANATVRVDGPADLRVSYGEGQGRSLPADVPLGAANGRLVIEHAAPAANAAAADGAAAAPGGPPDAPAAGSPTDAPANTRVGTPTATAPPAAAPRPAAAAATTGAVRIQSTPSGAIVTMEGRERGPTPITIDNLRPGRHQVLVKGAAGGRMYMVDVTAGTTASLDANLASPPQ